jgi:hypothetical protein
MADRPTDTIATLQNVLASAARIAQDLAGDPLVPRLLDIFARMPVEDRDVIVNVLDREVDLRSMTKAAPNGSLSGLNVTKPNPNARLYFRLTDSDALPHVAPEEVVQAVIRAARVVHRAAQRGTDLHQRWGAPIVEGLRRIAPDERATLRQYHHTLLALLEEAEREPEGPRSERA